MNDGSSRVGIVGVLVALLALAQGSIVLAADPGIPPGPASGRTVIKGTWIWSIERDKLGDRQEGHDLWWRHSSATERFLCPLNSAKIAVVKEKKWEEVDRAFLAGCALSDTRIPGSDNDNQLAPGTILAVRTIEGNLAKLKVLGYRPHENGIANYDLELEWVVYRGAPPTIPAPVPAPTVSSPGGTATLTVRVIEGESTPARGPTVTVQAADHTLFTPVARVENPAVFALPPGKYQVTARVGAGLETVPRRITLGGQPIELVLRTGTGTLELKLTAGGKPMKTIGNVELRAGPRLVAALSDASPRFQAMEGVYTVRVGLGGGFYAGGQHFAVDAVPITAGQTTQRAVEVPAGVLIVKVKGRNYGPGKLPYVQVDAGGKLVAALADSPARFQLLAGTYDLFVRESDRRLGYQQITLEAGAQLEVTLDADATP